jgi:hypothetical protein
MGKLVPNSVGRLDNLVGAIRTEMYFTAATLLNKEIERLEKKAKASHEAYMKDCLRQKEVEYFREYFRDHNFRLKCTEEVGG